MYGFAKVDRRVDFLGDLYLVNISILKLKAYIVEIIRDLSA